MLILILEYKRLFLASFIIQYWFLILLLVHKWTEDNRNLSSSKSHLKSDAKRCVINCFAFAFAFAFCITSFRSRQTYYTFEWAIVFSFPSFMLSSFILCRLQVISRIRRFFYHPFWSNTKKQQHQSKCCLFNLLFYQVWVTWVSQIAWCFYWLVILCCFFVKKWYIYLNNVSSTN